MSATPRLVNHADVAKTRAKPVDFRRVDSDGRAPYGFQQMAVRPVVVWPDPRLRQETVPVAEITDQVRALYRDLCDTMYAENGLGIAAIQIGDPTRMFLVEPRLAGRGEHDLPVAF